MQRQVIALHPFGGKYLSRRGEGSPCSTAECEALDATAALAHVFQEATALPSSTELA